MIIQNAAQITENGKITYIVSCHQHDFVSYHFKDGTGYSIDGGPAYIRRAGNWNDTRIKDWSLGEESSPEEIKNKLLWGHYANADGTGEFIHSLIKDLTIDHLKAIAKLPDVSPVHLEVVNYWIGQEELAEQKE